LNIRNGDDYTPPDEARFIGVSGLPASIYADGDFLGRPVNLASPTKGAFEFAVGNQPEAATYYVSSSGSDTNPGTQALPWQTLDKVNSMSFQPGDSILFKRGDIWNGELSPSTSGNQTNYISYGAYSTGTNPIIHATGSYALNGNKNYIRYSDFILENGATCWICYLF